MEYFNSSSQSVVHRQQRHHHHLELLDLEFLARTTDLLTQKC